MIILPAIDLKDGKCVRLLKGDFATTHQVADSPLETAKVFREAGAEVIHMVDLDGAKDGVRKNSGIVRQVCMESGLKVELGGGIRSMKDLEEVFSLGVYRAVIGSAAVTDPEFVKQAAHLYGERIAVGVDTLDGKVKTAGWIEDSGLDYLAFAKRMESLGVQNIIFTDIATDGALSGPPMERLKALMQVYSGRITASGGVSCDQDLVDLAALGVYGAIVGKAYYAGRVNLKTMIRRLASGDAEKGRHLQEKTDSETDIEIIAEVDGVFAGMAGIEAVGSKYKVRHRADFGISVDRRFWNLGIGGALTAACVECAKKAGFEQLELSAVADNERALAMYKKAGFVEYGRNPRGMKSRFTGYQEVVYMRLELQGKQ